MLKDSIENALISLQEEEAALTHKLGLVRQGILALQRLVPIYCVSAEAPTSATIVHLPQPVAASADSKPRSAIVSAAAESAIPYVSEMAQGDTLMPCSEAPATYVGATQAEEDPVRLLTRDVHAWRPVLQRENLEQIYNNLLLRRTRFTRGLPPAMDLTNPQVIRTLTNHLRHDMVPGYHQLCARLKEHTHLSYLYRCARDRATGAIFKAYPELACQASSDDVLDESTDAMHPTSVQDACVENQSSSAAAA